MAREIQLTRGLVAIVDDSDYELLSRFHWNAYPDRNTFYAKRAVRVDGGGQRTLRMHAAVTGWDRTDHIDGDGLNNQRGNLRRSTGQQNRRNSRSSAGSSSQYKGVSWHPTGKWQANIGTSPKVVKYLGRFASEVDAARAYDKAALALFGEFARPNFPKAGIR